MNLETGFMTVIIAPSSLLHYNPIASYVHRAAVARIDWISEDQQTQYNRGTHPSQSAEMNYEGTNE